MRERRDKVQRNVLNAAEKSNREFAIMYDVSGKNTAADLQGLITHWIEQVDNGVTKSQAYLKQDGVPVLGIWVRPCVSLSQQKLFIKIIGLWYWERSSSRSRCNNNVTSMVQI